MDLFARLLVALFVVVAPTVLYLGLLRGLRTLRDDALLSTLAESDDAPPAVSARATEALGERATVSDRAVACSTCGESNMLGARYCWACLRELY